MKRIGMINYPLIYGRIYYTTKINGIAKTFYYLNGEPPMSQEVSDFFKSIIGDGKGSITVGRDISVKDFGNGGSLFISLAATCDQSSQGYTQASQGLVSLQQHLLDLNWSTIVKDLEGKLAGKGK